MQSGPLVGGGGAAGDVAVHDCPLCQTDAAAAAAGTGGAVPPGGIGARSSLLPPPPGGPGMPVPPPKLPTISSGEVAASMGNAALSLNEPGSSSSSGHLLLNEADIYGGYPMKFLVMVVRFVIFHLAAVDDSSIHQPKVQIGNSCCFCLHCCRRSCPRSSK